MISFPILFREFRVVAQSKRTFLLRILLGAILTLAVLTFMANRQSGSRWTMGGDYLLRMFAGQLYVLILVAAPALTCGCITDEKKDGTLGLLFLTNLNSADIILGKFISRGVDLLLLLISTMPFLFVPVMLGGASWDQTMAVAMNAFSLLLLCLAMGICCSTIGASTGRAMSLAYLGVVLYILLPPTMAAFATLSPGVERWLQLASPLSSVFQNNPRIAGTSDVAITLACCVIAAVLLLGLSMWRLPSSLLGQPFQVPRLRQWMQAWLPTLGSLLHRRRRRAPDRNLVRWLDLTRRGSWWALSTIALAFWIVWAAFLTEPSTATRALISLFNWLVPLVVKLMIVVSIARSFAGEKEDGSLELLLTTPISARQIVHGKMVAAITRYGLLCVAIGSFRYFRYYHMLPNPFVIFQLAPVVVDLFCSVCVCLLVSVWCRSVTQAMLWAIGATFVVGWMFDLVTNVLLGLVGLGSNRLIGSAGLWWGTFTSIPKFFINIFIARWAYRHLVKNLRAYAAR